jgi:hypothetical protein
MSLAHALLMAELLLKAIDNGPPIAPSPEPHTQEPSPMDDQTSEQTSPATPPAAPPDVAAVTTPETPTPDATAPDATANATSSPTPAASESTPPGDVQTLIGEITQLVQILDKNPDIFNFLRLLMAK